MRRRELIGLILSLAVGTRCGAYAAGPPSEYEVKAVFLFNFSQFVSWPPEAFGKSDAPLIIAVLGSDPFGHELDAVVKGEHLGTHPLEVRRYRDVSEIKECHILFIDRSEAAQLVQIVQALRGRSILTVSDIDDATRAGVMIDLVKQSDRIRLRINVAAARAGGLTISSKLLRPAEIVGSAEG
jgi:YfiR/HmsC-like